MKNTVSSIILFLAISINLFSQGNVEVAKRTRIQNPNMDMNSLTNEIQIENNEIIPTASIYQNSNNAQVEDLGNRWGFNTNNSQVEDLGNRWGFNTNNSQVEDLGNRWGFNTNNSQVEDLGNRWGFNTNNSQVED